MSAIQGRLELDLDESDDESYAESDDESRSEFFPFIPGLPNPFSIGRSGSSARGGNFSVPGTGTYPFQFNKPLVTQETYNKDMSKIRGNLRQHNRAIRTVTRRTKILDKHIRTVDKRVTNGLKQVDKKLNDAQMMSFVMTSLSKSDKITLQELDANGNVKPGTTPIKYSIEEEEEDNNLFMIMALMGGFGGDGISQWLPLLFLK